MRKSEFLKTHRGQLYRKRRRELATVRLISHGEPRSRRSISDDERREFQADLVAAMMDRTSFRGGVVLELDFSVTEPNPPSIHELAKTYIDLLQRPAPGSQMTLKNRLYRDDRQIKFLVVNYDTMGVGKRDPHILMNARPLRHLVDDLQLLSQIRGDELRAERRSLTTTAQLDELKNLWSEEDDENLDDLLDQRREHRADKSTYIKLFGERIWEDHDRTLRFQIQRAYLRRSDRWLRSALLTYPDIVRPPRSHIDGNFPFLSLASRSLLLTGSVKFAGLPRQEGEGNAFKKTVRAVLEDLVRRMPILMPLEMPLSITLFCVRPTTRVIDLDNIARKYVVPAVHEVFKPPSSFARAIAPQAKRQPENYRWLVADLERLKRMPPYSITRYTVIELPPIDTDPPEGEVRVALGDGMNPSSVLDELEQALDTWESAISR